MPTNCIAELAPPPPPINRSMRNPASFYLSTLRKMEGHGEMGLIAESFNPNMLVRMRSDEYESRSGSDNFEVASGDDQEGGDGEPPRKKKYHRHTPHQIQELETFFKECPHPDEKQRLDLSRRLGLETKQVKFWFQNRRTQMKTQIERHENVILRQENEKLRAENSIMKDALGNPICNNCGGPAIPVQISMEEHHLRVENARLKEELSRLCTLSNKFLVKQNPFLDDPLRITNASIGLELGVGRNSTSAGVNSSSSLPMRLNLGDGLMDTSLGLLAMKSSTFGLMGNEVPVDRSMLVELALNSMDELVKMAQAEGPLWIKALDGMEVLNREEYLRNFAPCLAPKPTGYVTEATRQSGLVIINSVALVETLMDAGRWQAMFPGLIASAATLDLVSNGMNGSPNGTLQVMNAEIQLLSPLIPIRQLRFIRFCKQHAEGLWAVVDVSVDIGPENTGKNPYLNCRKLPSGCIVQDMPNGYSKVIWIEHSEYDDSLIPQLYRPLLSSGIGFGANRWTATLQRQCECLAILMHPSMPNNDHSAISHAGKRSMLKLAQRMTDSFCYGICPSSVRKWEKLSLGNLDNDMRVMARKNVDDPGEPPGFLLSAATSVWMPVSRQKLFNFLRNEQLRSEWDILSNGGPMHEMVHIAKGQGQGNCVSLLRSNTVHANESSVLILQETWTDASCSAIVYAPVDVDSLNIVMSGGDSAYVPLLPSGFAILPDARSGYSNGGVGDNEHDSGGSLLTVGFQILVSSVPSSNLTSESVDTLNNVIANTIQRIKTVLHVE